MNNSQTLAQYLEKNLGLKSSPRDQQKERQVAKSIGLEGLTDLSTAFCSMIDSLLPIKKLEDLELTHIPNGIRGREINDAIVSYYQERGYKPPAHGSMGVLTFSKSGERQIMVSSTYLGDSTALITVEENLKREEKAIYN